MENTSNNEGTPSTQVKRGLKHRHLTMIALGGTIGTGLFVASGATISQAGPLGALVAYIAIGLMVFFLMTSLGEMASYLPVSGSFASFADRYVDKAFGFAMGWNYWFNSAITVAVEAATVGVIMQFWLPHVPTWIWSTIVIALILLVNLISAKAYGEAEFWMATIKVIAVIAFIVIGLATIFGVMSYKPDVARNLSAGGNHGFVGGIGGMIAVFMIAGFSFQGTEIVGIAAGESENPEKNVPSAIKQVFWRIIIFYFLSIFVIGALVYYKDPSLLRAATQSDITVSPFTLVFERAGLAAAASVMNAVILTSVISSANSWLYAASRMLFGMAKEGHAPKIFAKTNTSNGVPIYAILATVAIGLLAFLTSIFGTEIYFYLVAASGLSGFLAWIGIAICHFRFRRAFIKQGHKLSELGYHAKWFPIGPIIALILSIIIVIGQITTVTMNAQSIITTYLALPLFLILYFSYKIVKKTKLIPLEEVDLSRDID
ncbi:amino acid permease [Lactococcus formosensis]|jgi:lysine-specific permease|uniref:Amino acid permease n=1 Tax=Lactococcus formosensis TaxID=1281486 RepID=A0A9X4P357_9LACT|nr:amino acid permease [Lactococcus formosensis]MCH1724067.1 amino acid permease [Lactococcus formosensis]MCO7181162.1 amino acid permease [Lactococcus formosensis]MDG6112301.1 amino acid permease [Lactococcus formosensis]MDG6114602.1 amino acid permease [Lactococcus formosensis]MDG6116733.1 amino acid permease [Lactococcus formosensis]